MTRRPQNSCCDDLPSQPKLCPAVLTRSLLILLRFLHIPAVVVLVAAAPNFHPFCYTLRGICYCLRPTCDRRWVITTRQQRRFSPRDRAHEYADGVADAICILRQPMQPRAKHSGGPAAICVSKLIVAKWSGSAIAPSKES